ncbi:MAG: YqeG family HAD IIIA-type phosphatase [Acutalibacteraceae bacterium]|nr:YqeG family HAD IIIA-type phosphatase [Acutalibacteraceae bacterium]
MLSAAFVLEKAMFKPSIKIHRVTDITADVLIQKNIKALILDVDNTLSTHHGMELVFGLEDWIRTMQNEGIRLLILSNSKERRVKPFAEKIGLDFCSLGLKPLPFGYMKAKKRLKLKRREIAIVGDQMFTDVLGGRLFGITTIMTDLILPEDKISFKVRRKMEKILLKKMKVENGYGC